MPPTRTLIRAAVLIAAGALVASCSSGPKATSSTPHTSHTTAGPKTTAAAGLPATCSMLTLDQVKAALGETSAPGKQEPNFDTPECEWDPASGHNGAVTLDVGPWVGDPGIKPLSLGKPVSGLGDEAYDSGNTGLFVRKGSNGFRISVFNVQQGFSLDLEKQLAVTLLGEM